MNKQAIIYCRVDHNKILQPNHSNINFQRYALENFATLHNIDIIGYYEDIGYTGSDINRPGLCKLLADTKTLNCRFILVFSLDRLFLSYTERFNKYNALQIYSIKENLEIK